MNLRHIRVEISQQLHHQYGGIVAHEAHMEVETDRDKYSLRELVPEDDFTRRFDWFVDRAKREIADLVKKSEK